jgi:predicted component of type VI protein secretion system
MAPKPDPLHERFRRVLAEEVQRQSLRHWMERHRQDVEALMNGGEMDWERAARHFASAGLRDDQGERLNAKSAERIWREVSRTRRRT